jgi:hypothetical protein
MGLRQRWAQPRRKPVSGIPGIDGGQGITLIPAVRGVRERMDDCRASRSRDPDHAGEGGPRAEAT